VIVLRKRLTYDVIAILVNEFSPSEIALTTAVRSAQVDNAYETFSTLHPEYILPVDVNKAAPTLIKYIKQTFRDKQDNIQVIPKIRIRTIRFMFNRMSFKK
jgi:hypothetical protein